MRLPKQSGKNTCWAACIQLLQQYAGEQEWHEWCVADPSVSSYPPCSHSTPEAQHDVPLLGTAFALQAKRCKVRVTAIPASGSAIDDALRHGVAPILRMCHYQIVLYETSVDRWRVYDPTWGDEWEEAKSATTRKLEQAWVMSV